MENEPGEHRSHWSHPAVPPARTKILYSTTGTLGTTEKLAKAKDPLELDPQPPVFATMLLPFDTYMLLTAAETLWLNEFTDRAASIAAARWSAHSWGEATFDLWRSGKAASP
jgi:hypothetical protein